ncbi:MAG: hypothetical protein K8U03_08525 [Planctomycetia bacterium]|nr:hypothetical protein [Planctomycetia bacterium]
MAKIPSRKFSTTKKKIASRGFSKAKTKIPSRGFTKAPRAEKKMEAPVLMDRPADEQARQKRVADLKAQAKLKPASELQD